MKLLHIGIVFILFTAFYTSSAYSQQYAITEDGRRVILHRNGSWEYLHSHEEHPEAEEESGRKARILLDRDIMLYLDNGQLVDFSVQSNGVRLYDNMTGKLKKIGRHEIEYDFHTEKISRIGNTHFKYSFFHGKLTDISGETPGVRITLY